MTMKPDITGKVLQTRSNLAVKADPAHNMYEVFTIKATVSVTRLILLSHTVGVLMRWKSYDVHQVLQAIDTII